MQQVDRAARDVVALPVIPIHWSADQPGGGRGALEALLLQAAGYVRELRQRGADHARAMLGRLRGTAPGASFGAVVDAIRRAFPRELQAPFEGSDHVAGAALQPHEAGLSGRDDGLLFLRFAAATTDLPMHAHEESDRLIYVLEGRGTFHVAPGDWRHFDPQRIRSTPIRARDILLFAGGTVHTFSTDSEPLLLLSYHAPFIPLQDPRQYTLPSQLAYPGREIDRRNARPACDPAWTLLA